MLAATGQTWEHTVSNPKRGSKAAADSQAVVKSTFCHSDWFLLLPSILKAECIEKT